MKRLESNHLPSIYYLLENDFLKLLSKSNLENQLTRLLSILDYEKFRELELYKKIAILESISSKSTDENIHNFYKSEIIEI